MQNQEIKSYTQSITQKLDSLDFSKWHMVMVLSLGLVWIFDGYQVSLLSIMSQQILKTYTKPQFHALASAYQIGCIIGSIIFGFYSYIAGRKKVFQTTLIIYAIGILLSSIQLGFWSFIMGRALTGISVGGQFTAIFTSIDQFLPPKVRGRVNIGIDGTWHLGGAFAAILNIIIGDFQQWRLLFLIGLFGVISLFILRRNIPQSPRWLIMKGENEKARKIITQIEQAAVNEYFFLKQFPSQEPYIINHSQQAEQENQKKLDTITVIQEISNVIVDIVSKNTRRLLLCFLLIFSQGLFFSSVYYKYPQILQQKFGFNEKDIALFMLPLSITSFISTLLFGTCFDTFGRKIMLLITYGLSGIFLFIFELFSSTPISTQLFMCIIFLVSSSASSSANLISSEIFPTNGRTIALSLIFIVGMSGGIVGVWVNSLTIPSILMILSGIFGFIWCPKAECKSLQQIAKMN